MRRWMSRKFDEGGDGTRIYSVIDLLQIICHGVGGEGECHSTCMANKQNPELCFPGSCDCEAREGDR